MKKNKKLYLFISWLGLINGGLIASYEPAELPTHSMIPIDLRGQNIYLLLYNKYLKEAKNSTDDLHYLKSLAYAHSNLGKFYSNAEDKRLEYLKAARYFQQLIMVQNNLVSKIDFQNLIVIYSNLSKFYPAGKNPRELNAMLSYMAQTVANEQSMEDGELAYKFT